MKKMKVLRFRCPHCKKATHYLKRVEIYKEAPDREVDFHELGHWEWPCCGAVIDCSNISDTKSRWDKEVKPCIEGYEVVIPDREILGGTTGFEGRQTWSTVSGQKTWEDKCDTAIESLEIKQAVAAKSLGNKHECRECDPAPKLVTHWHCATCGEVLNSSTAGSHDCQDAVIDEHAKEIW